MKLNELKPALGSTTAPRRLGRGVGSGLGKTSGKGHKGAKARSGGGKRPGFEGGQMPLVRQLPKRGFKNIFAKEYATVNVSELEVFENGTEVTSAMLVEKKIIRKELDGLKVLGNGELTKKLTVKAVKFTGSAKEKIEAVGGTAEVIGYAGKDEECLAHSGAPQEDHLHLRHAAGLPPAVRDPGSGHQRLGGGQRGEGLLDP